MNVLSGLRTYLLGDAAIVALVAARVYPVTAPQGETRARLVLTPITGFRQPILHGPASVGRPRYQVDAWDVTYEGAQSLGNLVRQRLEGQNATWTDTSSPPVSIGVQIEFVDDRVLFETDVSGGHYRHSADYYIWHGTNGGTV
jgi:hypothetical protein